MSDRYEVTVWDITNGDIVRKAWDADDDELAEIEAEHRDEPTHEVQIEPKF